jgi:NAD(P)-dependent dehydrogenase (short-subunit alcohol dehydrogenase family)
MIFQFKGKHVVVTGGSSGIGLWAAIYAARKGADVTIVARKMKLLGLYFFYQHLSQLLIY